MEILTSPVPDLAWRRLATIVAALLLLWTTPLAAQRVTAATLKAAFLYNFANFAEWPADALAPRQTLSLCIVGDNAVADALTQTVNGRRLDTHELTVEVVQPDAHLLSCHLLYINALDVKRTGPLLASIKSSPIFTVSDGDQFAGMGGVAQLIVENGHIRFAFNLEAARRANLKISSKLLSLATIIKDQYDVQP
jgi:hypothetical protein